MLLCSHLLGEIEQTATHIGILSHGRLVLEGALAALRAGLAPELVMRTDDPGAPSRSPAIGFDVSAQDDALHARLPPGADVRDATAALVRALCAADVSLYAIAPREQSLERLYHQATHVLCASPTRPVPEDMPPCPRLDRLAVEHRKHVVRSP